MESAGRSQEGLEQEGVDDVVRVGGAGLGVVLGHGSDAASPPPRAGTFHAAGCVSLQTGSFDAVGDRIPVPLRATCPRPEKVHPHAQHVPTGRIRRDDVDSAERRPHNGGEPSGC